MNLVRKTLTAVAITAVSYSLGLSQSVNDYRRAHERQIIEEFTQLLAIPNVVGVYVGVIEKTNKPCLKVMLARQPGKDDRAIPNTIEGYPVITEVTGEIRPLGKP